MSITDGTFVCSLCGEWQTGCSLCGTAPLFDKRKQIQRELEQEKEGEFELWRQSESIKGSKESMYIQSMKLYNEILETKKGIKL